jgi:hypothetical protein
MVLFLNENEEKRYYFFPTSLNIKTTCSLQNLHFFSLFLFRKGGIESAIYFFYLSAARIKQVIVGYIGLG